MRLAGLDDFVGDDKAPSLEQVNELARHLERMLVKAKATAPGQKRLVLIHNIFTVYSVSMLNFLTGYRPVRSPLQCFDDWDQDQSLLFISDKDDVDGYMSRYAYVPPVLEEQLINYSDHRVQIFSELQAINSSLPILREHERNLHPQLLRILDKGDMEEKALKHYSDRVICFPFLFLLNDKLQYRELRPSECLTQANTDWLQLNSGRHFFRTQLVQRGCTSEIIDAAMGHWDHGNEPFGPYSCLSPTLFKSSIKEHIDQMADDCCWIPLKV